MAQTWVSDAAGQRLFVNTLEEKLLTIRNLVAPVTVYQAAAPTAAEITDAWTRIYPPASDAPLHGRTQWVDTVTGKLKNSYATLEDYKLHPISPVPEAGTQPFSLIQAISAGDATAAATQTFSNIPQTFRHLCLYVQWRDTAAAATANLTVRLNAVASATYGFQYQAANSGFNLGAEQTAQTGFVLTTPANSSVRSYYHEGLLWIYNYADATRPKRVYHRAAYMWGASFAATTTTNIHGFGLHTPTTAVTSLALVGTTGMAAGSRVVLFGV